MKVAIDAAAVGSHIGGDETWLTGLLEGLARCVDPDTTFPLLLPEGAQLPEAVANHPAFPTVAVPRRRGFTHFALDLPRVLRSEEADLAISITHAALRSPTPSALVIGDLSFHHHPELFPKGARLRLQTLVPRQARRARVVLVPSNFTRQDLIETYKLDPARIAVVPNRVVPPRSLTAAERHRAEQWAAEAGIRLPFVLYLGNLHPRKNVGRLIWAFLRVVDTAEGCDAQLVVAGGRWWDSGDEARAAAGAPPGRVLQVGRVDDTVRRWLLSSAAAVAYPSIFEGFGLPPLEAMSFGTPVLAGDRTSLPEVLGDAALLVDPLDVDQLAEGLVALLGDEALRSRLSARGPVRAAEFNAERVGDAAWRALSLAAASPRRRPNSSVLGSDTSVGERISR